MFFILYDYKKRREKLCILYFLKYCNDVFLIKILIKYNLDDLFTLLGDHALIDINKLLGLNPKQVTVRTKSRDSQSSDSIPTQIPMHILKDKHPNEKVVIYIFI